VSAAPGSAARVTVCLAVRDGMPYLPEAVASILAQSVRDLALLVVDDGSSDGTAAYLATLADPRVRVVRQEAAGLAAALNRCLPLVESEYLARMDADDVARPERLAAQLDFMAAHTGVVAAGTAIEYFTDGGRRILPRALPVGHEAILRALTGGGHGMCHPTLVVRSAAARAVGGYRCPGPGQMTQFVLSLAALGELANLDRVLLAKRVRPGSVSWREAGAVARAERLAAAQWRHPAGAGDGEGREPWPVRLRIGARALSQVAYRRALVAHLRARPGAALAHLALAAALDPASAVRRLAARQRRARAAAADRPDGRA
jgi:glycosyltransferase involved in cell wall biosynthesis